MCGITGFTGKNNKKLLLKMLSRIKHRGPDEKSTFFSPGINAGMNRLSIIDLHKNLYPMKYKNLVLLYNGEIYNFPSLKKKLKQKRIKFKTSSDAEVILPLFHLHGPKGFSRLEGMFAIFIYDQKNKKIYLARDQAGEKPLYFYQQGDFFAFASELKALLLLPKLKKSLNPEALASYLFQGHVFAPDTIIKKIKKIPPGYSLEFNLHNKIPKLASYAPSKKIPAPTNKIKDKTKESVLVKKLDHLISQSVKSRLVADVPVGCFLSGGIDSTLITFLASERKKRLQTFSIAFPGFEKYDESELAQLASQHCQTIHTQVNCTPEKARLVIENIGQLIDEPIIDAAFLPLYLLAQEARKKIKVALTGEGADELFGGYQRYQQELFLAKIHSFLKTIPFSFSCLKTIFPHRFQRLYSPISQHYSSQRLWKRFMLDKFLKKGYSLNSESLSYLTNLDKSQANKDPLLLMQKTDLKGFLPEQLLMKVDKATMAHSLEARCPYLDSKIVNFALNLTANFKIKRLTSKYLLKKVAEKYLPSAIVWRKKHGFSVPLNYWFSHELRGVVFDSLKQVKNYPQIFNSKYYRFVINQHLERKQDYADQIWAIIVLTKFLKYHRFNF